VHAVRSHFLLDDTEGILLVNASDVFNALNHIVALHNICHIFPPLATILIKCYRSPVSLFISGDVLFSQEGTTQCDPLAMPMYALATLPLIAQLPSDVFQVWYADNACAGGDVTNCDSGGNVFVRWDHSLDTMLMWSRLGLLSLPILQLLRGCLLVQE